ncbi:MAG: hypothetical protein PHT31_01730 [Candidatus Omnitrophica bacterium]|nr:hypothetical protein [Candidatus Omnitrophota bacterium]MDD5652868.1 hypothetical protein [Candidatus Omnitrophota bacterium]
MKNMFKGLFLGLFFLLASLLPCLAQAPDVNSLVDQFKQATDLKRSEMAKDIFGKDFSTGGIVANVEEYNFFNEKKDLSRQYFRVTTEVQNTTGKTPYQVNFLLKDLNAVKDIAKGQKIQENGKIIKIIDERLQVALWLYVGELSPEEKELFLN